MKGASVEKSELQWKNEHN